MIDASTIKAKANELGFDRAGVCEAVPPPHLAAYKQWVSSDRHATMSYLRDQLPLRSHPATLLPSARSIIAVALNYNQDSHTLPGAPHIARYALGRDYHKVMRSKLRLLGTWVEEQFPSSETRACVDSAPILERDYAHLAGLGWFGKNTCLIDSKTGSWFFIGLLLTSLPLKADPLSAGSCGTCTKCIESCPTGAIIFSDGRWQVDARNCISYLTIEHKGEIEPALAEKIGNWTFGCDICQEVCPFNEPRLTQPLRATETREPDFKLRRQLPPLSHLRQIGEDEWDILTRGSAIRRAGLHGLRRNAAINLANLKPHSSRCP